MKTLHKVYGGDQVPPAKDGDNIDWSFWEGDFTYPVTPYPTEHMLGKTSLDYSVELADTRLEQGSALTESDHSILRLMHDYPYSSHNDLAED